MHEDAPPHCGCCARFQSSLVVDMVMNWGRCNVRVKSPPLTPEQVQRLKEETQAGNYETLYALEKEGALFMPSFEIAMECVKYWDYDWGPNPPP